MPKDLLQKESYLLQADTGAKDQTMFGLFESDSKSLRLSQLEIRIADMRLMSQTKAELMLDCATLYLDFDYKEDAWRFAKETFDFFIENRMIELAVVSCKIMASSDQAQSLVALANGIWLGITYPIDPAITVSILQPMIDESPVGSETAAVAAVAAHYIADIRRQDSKESENLLFFTQQTLGKIAAEHRHIKNQDEFEIWMAGNEFDDPKSFLLKLSKAVSVLVNGDWWYDKNQLRHEIF